MLPPPGSRRSGPSSVTTRRTSRPRLLGSAGPSPPTPPGGCRPRPNCGPAMSPSCSRAGIPCSSPGRSHRWRHVRPARVRVRATSVSGAVSDWSAPLVVTSGFLGDGEWTAQPIGLADPEREAQPFRDTRDLHGRRPVSAGDAVLDRPGRRRARAERCAGLRRCARAGLDELPRPPRARDRGCHRAGAARVRT